MEYPPAPFHGSGKPEDNIPCDEMTDGVEGYNLKNLLEQTACKVPEGIQAIV